MNAKIMLLAISIVAVGLFAMPSTLSLLTGQHSFIGGDQYSNGVKCKTCHTNVYTELTATSRPHNSLSDCRGCHAGDSVTVPLSAAGSSGVQLGGRTNQHAAKINQCTACHLGVITPITNNAEAHKPMYSQALDKNSVGLSGADEACTACHTNAGRASIPFKNSKLKASATQAANGAYTISYKLQ